MSTIHDCAEQASHLAGIEGSLAAIKLACAASFLEATGDASGAGAAFTLGRMLAREYGLPDHEWEQAIREARFKATEQLELWARLRR